MIRTVIPNDVEAELREQASRHGQNLSHFATAVTRNLKEAERQAEGITDDQARELLLYSALENVVPRSADELKEAIGGSEAMFGLLFLVLSLCYFLLTKETRQERQEAGIVPGSFALPGSWHEKNRMRLALLEKRRRDGLTAEEQAALVRLQDEVTDTLESVMPLPPLPSGTHGS